MVDLGTLGGRTSSAFAINDRGDVGGLADLSDGTQRVFFWTVEDGMIDIGTLGGNPAPRCVQTNPPLPFGCTSWFQAMNNTGDVIGTSVTAEGQQHGFLWNATAGMVDLSTLGGSFSAPVAVNASSHVVGQSAVTGNGAYHAFLWTEDAGMTDLGTLGGRDSSAAGINDRGDIVGSSNAVDGSQHGFVWTARTGMIDLGLLPGASDSYAVGVDARGQVIGSSGRAFVWLPKTGLNNLGILGNYSVPTAITNSGQVVGWYGPAFGSKFRPFGWTEKSGMIDLGTIGGVYARPWAVNPAGDAVGEGFTASGDLHAVQMAAAVELRRGHHSWPVNGRRSDQMRAELRHHFDTGCEALLLRNCELSDNRFART